MQPGSGSPGLPEAPSESSREDSARPADSAEPPAATATRIGILPTVLAFEAVVLALAFLLAYLLDVPLFRSLRVTWEAIGIAAGATLPLVLLGSWSLRSRSRIFVKLRQTVFEAVVPLFAGSSTGTLLAVSLAAGVAEEALFRGVAQTALAGALGQGTALATTSALFGLAHPVSALYVLFVGAIGAYLGGLFIATGNLLVPIVVHAAYDFVGLKMLLRAASRYGDRSG